ncbi:MAG: class I SAM-dependent methyltransferase [Myxococcota bacterium]
MALVPPHARRVVDVGCGEGHLARALMRERPGTEVFGIEPSVEAAARARGAQPAPTDLVVGRAEDGLPAHWPAPDCIVFADVLEHLVDPWGVLAAYVARLAPGGSIVASIPNVGHYSVLVGALRGRWDYAPAGLLDRTHLRFFTVATALELLRGAGLEPELVRRTVRHGGGSALHGLTRRVLPWLERGGALGRSLHDLVTYQLLVRARARG